MDGYYTTLHISCFVAIPLFHVPKRNPHCFYVFSVVSYYYYHVLIDCVSVSVRILWWNRLPWWTSGPRCGAAELQCDYALSRLLETLTERSPRQKPSCQDYWSWWVSCYCIQPSLPSLPFLPFSHLHFSPSLPSIPLSPSSLFPECQKEFMAADKVSVLIIPINSIMQFPYLP